MGGRRTYYLARHGSQKSERKKKKNERESYRVQVRGRKGVPEGDSDQKRSGTLLNYCNFSQVPSECTHEKEKGISSEGGPRDHERKGSELDIDKGRVTWDRKGTSRSGGVFARLGGGIRLI